MTVRFDDQVAIITGSGGGLGRAYALSLARRGASVLVHDIAEKSIGSGRRQRMVDLVVEEILASGGRAVACHEDIVTPMGPPRIVDAAMDAFGRVDVLINNAGIARHRPFLDQSREDLEAVLSTHIHGSFRVTQGALVHMQKAGYGRILFVSSSGAAFGMPNAAAYAAAKGGLLGLMKVVALESAVDGVCCNAILPGAFTPMAPKLTGNVPRGFERLYRACDRIEQRYTPEFVVPLVDFLVSSHCTVTGEIYSAQAGHYSRVAVVKGSGWTSPGQDPPTAEDIRNHFVQIKDLAHWTAPVDAIDSLNEAGDALDRNGKTS